LDECGGGKRKKGKFILILNEERREILLAIYFGRGEDLRGEGTGREGGRGRKSRCLTIIGQRKGREE